MGAAEDPVFPLIRQGALFKDNEIKSNLMEIFSAVHRRESVLSGSSVNSQLNPSTVAISQLQKLQQQDNNLLQKIEAEILRRQQLASAASSPAWAGNVVDMFGKLMSKNQSQSNKKPTD